ncbi:uncharacterized protein PV09_01537 [Verruconis gallopava]|uniref:Yos1-like protein n=1 Tax=Verruconis gallopava TaxID=253628 RepID=A0A0D2AM96_9PEZI|nr:uncharacterized protein PV09_01537 [Verruconis gallopava]KIW07585.1 hypothetical protein PV09_01537 [Verruconis gallopava]
MALFLPTFGFGSLFYASVLTINAIAILSEDRFLARIGFGNAGQELAFGQPRDDTSIKAKTISLVNSIRMVARVPLIFVNLLVIIYLLLLG